MSSAADDLALFHRSLSALTRSEVPLSRALRMVAADLSKGSLRRAAGEMAAEVESGVPLTQAYGKRRSLFPRLYRALLEAGAAAGDLPGVLADVAAHAAERARAARRLKKALAYPFVTALFVLFVGGGALAFAAPRLWRLPTGSGTGEAWFTWSPPIGLLLAAGFVAIFVVAAFLFSRFLSPLDRPPGFTLPVLGPIRLAAVRAAFARAMALLLRRKTPLPKALGLAAELFDDRRVRERLAAASVAAERGEGLTGALDRSGLFPGSLLFLVESADGSQDAAGALEEIARIEGNRLERGIDRLEVLVTPLAELVIGIAVFFFAVSYLLPMFRYTEALFGGPS